MKILHICLAGAFTENLTYQENFLVDINAEDGHDVVVIADCTHFTNGLIVPSLPENKVMASGARLVRIPADRVLGKKITEKIRKFKRLCPLIQQFAPDVILHHGIQAHSLITAAKYKRNHPHVKLYADNHAEASNSARNWISLNIQHRMVYNHWIRKSLPYIEKILCISPECKGFVRDVYGIDPAMLEDFPLGGTVLGQNEISGARVTARRKHGIPDGAIMFLHAGKLDQEKKTLELMDVFGGISDERFCMVIAGSVSEDIRAGFEERASSDKRIIYLDWVSGEELITLYCACDLYVQPGKVSVNAQNAICCGAPVLLAGHEIYKAIVDGNGWLIESIEQMDGIFRQISGEPSILAPMREASHKIAKEKLDYRKIAARLYE